MYTCDSFVVVVRSAMLAMASILIKGSIPQKALAVGGN
jgi:hypothetical protein